MESVLCLERLGLVFIVLSLLWCFGNRAFNLKTVFQGRAQAIDLGFARDFIGRDYDFAADINDL
jgi:hypothetical protein